MSKLYQMNRMRYSAAAGSPIGAIIGGAGKLLGKLFQSKASRAAIAAAKKLAANPIVQTVGIVGAGEVAGALMNRGGGKSGGGASGGWSGRRRKGITGSELRGFHKVARLLHKEGMVVKHARRGGK